MSNQYFRLFNNFEIIYDPSGAYVLIELTQGQFGMCDVEDWFGGLDQHKWFSHYNNPNKTYYIDCGILCNGKNKTFRMHRLIMNVFDPKVEIDHINRDTLDNRRTNLRISNHSENQCNTTFYKTNKTGHKNICLFRGSYRVEIQKDKKHYYLGLFKTINEAINVRDENLIKLHGEFAHK